MSSEAFFESPILNSPYAPPNRHWALGDGGQPTGVIELGRRRSDLTTPIPKARVSRGKATAQQSDFLQGEGGQEYNPTETINGIPGLGGLAWASQKELRADIAVLSVIVIGLTAVAIDALLRLLERRLAPWKGRA